MDFTTFISLGQPEYLSDGEAAVLQMNTNLTILDNVLGTLVQHSGETVALEGSMIINTL